MLKEKEIIDFEDFLSSRRSYYDQGFCIIYNTLKKLGNIADISEAEWISLGFIYNGNYSIVTRIELVNGCVGMFDNHGMRHEYFNDKGIPYQYLPNLVDVVYNLLQYKDYVTGSTDK